MMQLNNVIHNVGKVVDPFDCASIPITQEVHHLLSYFGSLFFKQDMGKHPSPPFHDSACFQVIQDCIFDKVQMTCIVSAMASRREHFDGQFTRGRSSILFQAAMTALRNRIEHSGEIDTQLIYCVMKLCHTESYRSNFEEAIVHLNGARVALKKLGSWCNLDSRYTSTLCGSGHAFHVSKVWKQPMAFPCLVDPGRAISCFPTELVHLARSGSPLEESGEQLLAAVSSSSCDAMLVSSLQQTILDLSEFSIVKHNILLSELCGVNVPTFVTQWLDLRRYSLLSRLLSAQIVRNDFLHALRVSLVLWLTVIANYKGFDHDLQSVATHLQDVVMQIRPIKGHCNAKAFSWMLMMGAVAGDAQDVRLWFGLQLSVFLEHQNGSAEQNAEKWVTALEFACRGTLYCELVQKDSLIRLAKELSILSTGL